MKKAWTAKKTLAVLFLACVFVVLMFELFRYMSCYFYLNKVTQNETQILRIMLFGSSENPEGQTVSAKISVLDGRGTEIATIERSWPEPYLAVDFRSAKFLKQTYYFPELVYGTTTVSVIKSFFERRSGSELQRYYVENWQCLLGTDSLQKKVLYNIFSFSLNKNTVNLSTCENGIYYGVFNEGGKLVLRQE